MGRIATVDLAAWSVTTGAGAQNLLAVLKSASIKSNFDLVDGKPITRLGKSNHHVKKGLTIEYSNFSTISQPQRVTSINVTAVSIAGVDYIATCRSGSFSGEFTHTEGSGVADFWKAPYVTEIDYKARFELQLVDSATANIWQNMADEIFAANFTAVNITVSFTINSVVIALPMTVSSVEWNAPEGGLQSVTVECAGRSPDSGTYPTTTTNAAGVLLHALTTPTTALAFTSQNATTGAFEVTIAGNAVFQSFSVEFQDASLMMEKYVLSSQGTMTPTV